MARVKVTTICLPPEVQADGKQAAKEDGRSLSGYIAHLIRQDLKNRPNIKQAA